MQLEKRYNNIKRNDMEIIFKKTNELIPYANNTRTHPDGQVQQIASSIKEFGFTNPVLLDEKDGVIAGHGRIMGAKLLQLDEIPTITLKGLTEAQMKAYIIADNKLALNAGWDEELLVIELQTLNELDFDYSNLGFDFDFEDDNWETDIEIPVDNLSEKEEQIQIVIKCSDDQIKQQLEDEIAIIISTKGIVGAAIS